MLLSGLFTAALGVGICVAASNDKSENSAYTDGKSHGRCAVPHTVPFVSDLESVSFGHDYTAVQVGDGVTYRYVHIRPQREDKPYILFTHGFPSSSYDWRNQITYFASKGYGVIVPDLLGYGGTDKPKDPQDYRLKKMAEEVVGILDCEGIKTVLGVGHDWGSPLLSRLANYFPSRFRGYAFLDVGYQDPSSNTDNATVAIINKNTTEALGYATFGYWLFFTTPEAAPLIDSHPDSFFTLAYTSAYSTLGKTDFAAVGALQKWLAADRRAPLGSWITDQDRLIHNKILSHGGYGPPLNWYNVEYQGLNIADNKGIPSNRATLDKPVLLITAAKDPIIAPSVAEASTRPFAPDLRVKQVQTGHWVQLEAKDEVNGLLEQFFEEVLSKKY